MASTRRPPLLARLAAGVKAATVSDVAHPNSRADWYGGPVGGFVPSHIPEDYWQIRTQVDDGGFSGLVEILLGYKLRVLNTPGAPQAYWKPEPGADPEPDPESPLNLLLDEPNRHMTWGDLADILIVSEDVVGTGYLLKVRAADSPDADVVELWPLYPTAVTPLSRGGDFLTGWRYEIQGVRREYEPDDVIVFRSRVHRHDHRLGRAPIASLVREVATDEEAAKYTNALLANMGVPGVVFGPKDPTLPPTSSDVETFQSTWQSRFGGTNRGKPFYSENYEIMPVSFSPKDLDLRVLRQIPEERLSGATGVPAILAQLGAGLSRGTFANVDGLKETFITDTIVPTLNRWSQSLTRGLVDSADRLDRLVSFDLSRFPQLQDDRNAEAVRLGTLVDHGILTVDEARAEIGYDVLPAGARDIDQGVGVILAETDVDDGDDVPRETSDPQAATRQHLWERVKGFDDDAWEARYEDAIGDVLAGWAARFAADAGLADTADQLVDLADRAVDGQQLRDVLNELGVELVSASARGDQAIPTKAATLNPDDVVAGLRKFLDAHATRRATGMSDWTRVRVRNVVRAGIDAGKTAADVAADVDRWLKSPERARTIARTEVTAARNSAANYAASVDPRPMWKIWDATGDGDTRPSHAAADGQRVLDFETFTVGGYALAYPGDPAAPARETVNCRCRMTYRLASSVPGGAQGGPFPPGL